MQRHKLTFPRSGDYRIEGRKTILTYNYSKMWDIIKHIIKITTKLNSTDNGKQNQTFIAIVIIDGIIY